MALRPRWLTSLVVLCILLAWGCGRQTRIVAVAGPPEHILLYERGMAAMREFTPEGYLRAIPLFERAAELMPANCDYRIQLAHASLLLAHEQELNSENFRPAWDRSIEAASCAAPDSPAALRLDAFASLDNFGPGRGRAALTKINQAIEAEPGNPLNWYVRWKLNPATNRQENALLKAMELDSSLALLHYEAGNYWLLVGEYENGKKAFERAIELSPRHFRSYIGLAQAISALDDEAEVEHLYKRAVELGPDFLEGRILLGDYYSGLEENELAREHYTAVIERNPRFEVAHLRMGLSWLQTPGSLNEAEKSFASAIEINPNSYEAWYYTGNIWFARGNLDKAREQYEEALKFVLNFPEALYALGTVHFRQDRINEAFDHFQRVLRTNRRHADAYFSRGNVHARRRQFFDAIDDYNVAIGIYGQQVEALADSISEYEGRGLIRKAEAERRRKDRVEMNIGLARESKARAEREIVGQ